MYDRNRSETLPAWQNLTIRQEFAQASKNMLTMILRIVNR
jgi:hypothetical protein